MSMMLSVAGTALLRNRTPVRAEVDVEAGIGSMMTSVPVGKGGFVSGNAEALPVTSRCPTSGRMQGQEVRASMTAKPLVLP